MSTFIDKIVTGIETGVKIIPAVTKLVQVFEQPEAAGQGASKKDALLGIVGAATDLLTDDEKAAIGANQVVKFIASVVDVVVKFLNAIGIFKK